MKTAHQLLQHLRANYPSDGVRAPMQQLPQAETVALWQEVDAYLNQGQVEDAGPPITCCCYCGVTQPYTALWVQVDRERVSCGGPDCVAF